MKKIIFFVWSMVFAINFSYSQTVQVLDTILPFDDIHWANMNCSALLFSSDSIAAYGSDYRIGANLYYKDFFNFQNEGEAYFQISFNNQGQWQAEQVRINGSKSPALSSGYSSNTPYFIHVKFNSDHSEDYVIATDNYDDAGGNIIETHTYNLSDKAWRLLASANFNYRFWDNYAGTSAYITLWEVRLKNVTPVDNSPNIISQETFDFEDGNIPVSIVPVETDWTVDMTEGYNSNASLHIEAPVTESRSVYMDLPENTVSITFDVKYQSETHKSAFFSVDSLASFDFDHSSIGCWKHYKWQFNDHQSHRVFWRVQGSNYDQLPGKLWIDNITVTYDNYSGIENAIHTESIIYPNPSNSIVYFNIKVNQYEIYNLEGELIKKGKITNHYISVNDLPKGLYWLKSYDRKGSFYFSKLLIP